MLNFIFAQSFEPLFALKILFLVIIFSLFIFTFVVYTQINIMNRIVNEVHSSFILKLLAILNLLIAISLFLFSLAIL